MRPFKFFFALAIGFILFIFFAKIVLFALVAAFFMTIVFGIARKAKHLIQRLLWEDDEYLDYERERSLPIWKEDFFSEAPNTTKVYLTNHRRIIVE